MEYFVSNSDENILDFISNPHNTSKVLSNQGEIYAHLKALQQVTDGLSNNQKAREADIKVIARFPQGVIMKLMEIEPDLLKDKKTFWKILNKYPIYKAYTTGAGKWQTRF